MASIDSFTVVFDRNGPGKGIVIDTNATGECVFANTCVENAVFKKLLAGDAIGCDGKVRRADGINVLKF